MRKHLAAGFTLVEMMLASVILIMLVAIVSSLTQTGNQAQTLSRRLTRATEVAQDITDDIRRELTSAVRLMHADPAGAAYVALLDLSGSKPPLTYRLPTLDEFGIFAKETALTPRSGNALLFARQAWSTVFTPPAGTGRTYRIEVYRMVHYYPAPEGAGPQAGRPTGLDLVKWVSEPLADGDEIDQIADPGDQAAVCQHLLLQSPDDNGNVHPRVEVVWLHNADPTVPGTLRHIQVTGLLDNNPQLPRPPTWQLFREPTFSSNSLLAYRHHSLATIYAPTSYQVGTFSVVSSTSGGFPHGLELQMIGPASARQVLLRLILVDTYLDGHRAHATLQTIIDAREV